MLIAQTNVFNYTPQGFNWNPINESIYWITPGIQSQSLSAGLHSWLLRGSPTVSELFKLFQILAFYSPQSKPINKCEWNAGWS